MIKATRRCRPKFIRTMRYRYLLLGFALTTATAFSQGYLSPYGEWRGQAQYQAFIKSVSDPAAHTVTNLTIDIDPMGKVVGASAENGCRMLGIAVPGIASTIVRLDVTLRDCRYAGLNRTYKGHLSVYSKERYAALSLQALEIGRGGGGTFNITSTMRR